MPVDTTFPHTYEVRELTELPNSPSLARYYYPQVSREGGGEGLLVEIRPEHGSRWLGVFGFGGMPEAPHGVFTTPDPRRVCVVSCGPGHLVCADDPTSWEGVRAIPVLDVRPVPAQGLLVFADYTDVVAYGRDGVAWRTRGLVSDGLRVTEVTETALFGTGDYHGREGARVWVDLKTGAWERTNPPR